MELGWKNDGLELGIENEGGDRAAIPRLVDDRIINPQSNLLRRSATKAGKQQRRS